MPLSMSCQHKFIAFAGYLPKKGLQSLVTDTHVAVDSVLKGYVYLVVRLKRTIYALAYTWQLVNVN